MLCHSEGALSPRNLLFPLGAGSQFIKAVILINQHISSGGLMATVKITVRPNGPYRVEAPEGSIELVDVNGTPYDLTGKPAFSLCRCGGSVNKPFCDGTHSKIGFQGAELAVKKADG
jgi:CDGSH-type Zn-finger protein